MEIMKTTINDLGAYKEQMGVPKKAEKKENGSPFTIREFNLMCTAVRYYVRHALVRQEEETSKERHRRIISKIELDSALNKLRKLTPQNN